MAQRAGIANLPLHGGQVGLAAKAYLSFGTDLIEELTKLAEKIYAEFPHGIFFTSKLILEHDNWYIRQLHSEAALTMLRRLHLRNMPMVILPMKYKDGCD